MKSDYSKESITEFLSRKYGEDIRLFPIKEGQESQAYWFSRGGREYVVRINSNMEGFKKDKYAYEHFRSDRVPIPEVVETGNFDGTHSFKPNGCVNMPKHLWDTTGSLTSTIGISPTSTTWQ